tara:strand:- start:180 stop:362 length:183 start_codon:yes stop_codon:yes gene_type:complete
MCHEKQLKNKTMETKIQIAINSLTDMREWSDRIGSDELAEIGFVVNLLRETLKEIKDEDN